MAGIESDGIDPSYPRLSFALCRSVLLLVYCRFSRIDNFADTAWSFPFKKEQGSNAALLLIFRTYSSASHGPSLSSSVLITILYLQQLCHQLALARVLERGVHVQVAFVSALQVVVVVRG